MASFVFALNLFNESIASKSLALFTFLQPREKDHYLFFVQTRRLVALNAPNVTAPPGKEILPR